MLDLIINLSLRFRGGLGPSPYIHGFLTTGTTTTT